MLLCDSGIIKTGAFMANPTTSLEPAVSEAIHDSRGVTTLVNIGEALGTTVGTVSKVGLGDAGGELLKSVAAGASMMIDTGSNSIGKATVGAALGLDTLLTVIAERSLQIAQAAGAFVPRILRSFVAETLALPLVPSVEIARRPTLLEMQQIRKLEAAQKLVATETDAKVVMHEATQKTAEKIAVVAKRVKKPVLEAAEEVVEQPGVIKNILRALTETRTRIGLLFAGGAGVAATALGARHLLPGMSKVETLATTEVLSGHEGQGASR